MMPVPRICVPAGSAKVMVSTTESSTCRAQRLTLIAGAGRETGTGRRPPPRPAPPRATSSGRQTPSEGPRAASDLPAAIETRGAGIPGPLHQFLTALMLAHNLLQFPELTGEI